MGRRNEYSVKEYQPNTCRAKGTNLPVHFKNTLETANAIRGMTIQRATAYLKNVIAHKECVPFKVHRGGVGRCRQAKQWKTTQGRWPKKSANVLLELLRNAVSNAEYNSLDCEQLFIQHIQVNAGQISHRRTFRAHGRIGPYNRHQSNVQIILAQKEN